MPAPMAPQSSPTENETDLAPDPQKLAALAPGTYVFHRSWGYGKIREHNELLSQAVIDFKGKPGHSMAFQYAIDSLQPLAPDHIYAKKSEDLAAVKALAKESPGVLVRNVIESLGAQATADAIQVALSPEVVADADWKKWWEGAKRALKKDGNYFIPTRKNEAFRILDEPIKLGGESIDRFRAATGVDQQLAALGPIVKHWAEINDPAIAAEITEVVNSTLSKLPRSLLPKGVELALVRDEILGLAGQPIVEGPQALVGLIPTTGKGLADVVEKVTGARQVRLLKCIQAVRTEEWPTLFLQILAFANGRMADSVTTVFAEAGRPQEVVDALYRLIRERNVSTDLLYWLCKNRDELFAPLFSPQLVMAILSVLEKDAFSDLKKGTKLYDLVHTDKDLMAALLRDAPHEDVRDTTRAIILTPVFKELDKRSLLAIIIKLYPKMQELVIGDRANSEDATLIVSWESLDRRKHELEEIVTKKIPENSKEIGVARSHGDLRENAEFKAAKEMQSILMRRKAELESILVRSQGTDFTHVETNVVNIGTIVGVSDVDTGVKASYTILGAWDSDPASGIISYLTPLAQALLKHAVGAVVKLQTEEGGQHTVRIDSITNYR
jgi:transcription elongation factor GreA